MRSRRWSAKRRSPRGAWKRRRRRSVSDFGRRSERIIAAPEAGDERALIARCRQARKDEHLAVLEGLHALKHALRFDAEIEAAYTDDPDALGRLAEALAPDIAGQLSTLVDALPADVFAALAPKAPETGVFALARRPSIDARAVLAGHHESPAIVLDDPAHLGNVGAVVRVAAAAGASAVITSGRHDPWDPAALRGSAGLHFALPVVRLDELPKEVGPLIAIDPEGEPLRAAAVPENALLAFGSERRGLSPAILEQADQRLALPMRENVSSLNLATAVAAVLYVWRLGSASR